MDMDTRLKQIMGVLDQLAEDTSVPRNIRRGAASARETLSKPGQAVDVSVASAIFILDELANDPNIPLHGRTQIWSIISHHEQINAALKK